MPARIWLGITQAGYFGTFLLLMLWYSWLAPSPTLPVSFVLLILGTPLLLPLRGLLHGRRYTVAWSLFLCLGYFTHGVTEAYALPEDRLLGGLEILFCLLWFIGGIRYIRASKLAEAA